jgi:transcriptional regulator with XRE-family HTH domain
MMMVRAARPNAKVGNQTRKASLDVRWRLSTNLKRLRQARGYTQGGLGAVCGLSNSYISNVEQGAVNISLANLEALANGLGCAAEDLLRTIPARRSVPPAPTAEDPDVL